MIPSRYAGLNFVRDAKRGREVSAANQEHVLRTLSGDGLLTELRAYLTEDAEFDETAFERLFLTRLSDSAWIERLLDELASPPFAMVEFVPQMKAVEEDYFNVLEIFWHPKASVFLSVVDAERAEAFSAPDPNFNVMGFTTHLLFVKGGPATIRIFEVGDGAMRTEERRVGPGDSLAVRGGRNSMKFLTCERDMAVVAVNVLTTDAHDVLRYEAATGRVLKRSTNDADAQRFFLYSTVLRQMERSDALDAVARLLAHDEPTLRWHAMREMLAIDAPAAAPHLSRLAAEDPSEVVRATAEATLREHRDVLFPAEAHSGAPLHGTSAETEQNAVR